MGRSATDIRIKLVITEILIINSSYKIVKSPTHVQLNNVLRARGGL